MRLGNIIFIAFIVVSAAAAFPVTGQTGVRTTASPDTSFTRITPQEMNVLLADVAETNPMALKRLEDPEAKQAQIDSLRELLAFASEAQKSGLAGTPQSQNELENIRAEVTAVNYDKRINKAKPAKAPFGYITDSTVAAYWGDAAGSSIPAALKSERKAKFKLFLDTKVSILQAASPAMRDRELEPDEIAQAREIFAKIQIYSSEYAKQSTLLPLSFRQKVALQIKLQQAQYLARLYGETLSAQNQASDAEIAGYLKKHPELDSAPKRAKAEGILARAKAGEDFAKLANEYSEDPGNKNSQNEPQGGLYANVGKGVMVPPFEQAALALEPGKLAPELVESDFGFHIIKLERKNVDPGGAYDVRHILITTAVSDPLNPGARPVPVKEYAKSQVEKENEQVIIDRIVASNKISVPEDFVIPRVVVPGTAPKKTVPAPKKRPVRKRA